MSKMLWIHEQRHRHRIPDRYGRVPSAPVVRGSLEDGTPALTTMERGGWKLKALPTERVTADGSFAFSTSSEDEAEYTRKKLERLARCSPGKSFEISSRGRRRIEEPSFNFRFRISALWPRFAAKIALNVGRELRREDWLREPQAIVFHELLWGRRAEHPPPWNAASPTLPQRETAWHSLGWRPPPDHFLVAMNGPFGPFLEIVLFGEDTYCVPLGGPELQEQMVWVLHTQARTWERLVAHDFFTRVVTEIIRADTLAKGGRRAGH